ncbi:MAG: DUF3644 domain-containing protein [Chloroherpetonaceae bacterium]|nr:DUF3644 domain-containing protein [Chloroherpetonaceae bacterium]
MEEVLDKLLLNSKSSQLACIEIHNKPTFPFRYELCAILNINSWELLLKSFIIKHFPKVIVIRPDGTTKPFDECLAFVAGELGKDFSVAKQNLEKIYEYRCNTIHFYQDDIDVLLFSLLSKNILLYHDFLLKYFGIDIASETNLILLPIGFKKPASPIDFLSNASQIEKSSKAVQSFVKSIIKSTEQISDEGIEDSILFSFKMSLINESRIKNADVVAAITRDKKKAAIRVENVISKFVLTDDENEEGVKKIKIDEENLFRTVYTQTYHDVTVKCKKLFSDFKINNNFNNKLKKLKNNPKFHKPRYLNLDNPKGGSKDYYSVKVYDELAKEYTKK